MVISFNLHCHEEHAGTAHHQLLMDASFPWPSDAKVIVADHLIVK